MKKYIQYGLALLIAMVLTACSTHSNYFRSQVNQNLLQENWMSKMNINPNTWTSSADRWFLTGDPNQTELMASRQPMSSAMTVMAVRVPQFNYIKTNGSFQVQIDGMQDSNYVYILGANNSVRQVVVEIKGNMIYVHQAKDCKGNLSNVIVRIGVGDLRGLDTNGPGKVSGRNLTGNCLEILSHGSGNVLLAGNMGVTRVVHTGPCTLTIMGANTRNVDIKLKGNGNLNISGQVGARDVIHCGDGCLTIVGACSDAMCIHAKGKGTTSIAGYANVKEIDAQDCSKVYMYWVNSNGLYVTEKDNAIVGLAGNACTMNIDLRDNSRFYGQYLHGGSVYVRTREYSHANITADKKLFASASDYSSIYFFGSPNIVSRFMTQNGTVIPVWVTPSNPPSMPCMTRPMVSKYKG